MLCMAWTVLSLIVTLIILNGNYIQGRSVAAPHNHVRPQSHNISHNFKQIHEEKIARTNSLNKTLINNGRRQIPRKKITVWKTLSDTFTQVVLGDDDYYDSSSRSDSRSESDITSLHSTKRPSSWSSLASSALAGLAPRIWAHLTSKNKKAAKKRMKTIVQITTFLPLQSEETGAEETAINVQAAEESKKKLIEVRPIDEDAGDLLTQKVNGEVSQGVKGKVVNAMKDSAIAQQLYKMAARREDLALLEREVSDSGRRLSFIEYAAILEIVVLIVIAAGVFRMATFPVPMPVFAKL